MRRHSCCDKQKVKRGLWSPEEDEKLVDYVSNYGHGCWSSVPKRAGLQRCGRSCRLRWMNYLRPDLKRGSFSSEEAMLIIELHGILGNRWAQIARHLPGRTDNEVKNFWNSSVKKKLVSQDFLARPPLDFPGLRYDLMHHENPNLIEDEGSAFFSLLTNPNIMSSNPSQYQDHELFFPPTTAPPLPITHGILHENSHLDFLDQPHSDLNPFLSSDMPIILFGEQLPHQMMDPNLPVNNQKFDNIGILSEITVPENAFPEEEAAIMPNNYHSTSPRTTWLYHNECTLIPKTWTGEGFIDDDGKVMSQLSTCSFLYPTIPNMVTTAAPSSQQLKTALASGSVGVKCRRIYK